MTRDRALVGGCLLLVFCLVAVLAVWSPREDDDTPSSYSTETHGAKAAYLLLGESGYRVERWTRPMSEFTADAHTVLILPEPASTEANRRAVRATLAAGGRVLATGEGGAAMLPGGSAAPGSHGPIHTCKANATAPLTPARQVEQTTAAAWTGPQSYVTHRCEGLASVVRYPSGRGQAVWWASPLPLENAAIAHANNLELLLASVGPPAQGRVVWDEAPAEEAPSLWSYAQGTPVHLLWWQLMLVGMLLLLSFGRRSGPLRPDPIPSRAAPVEFVSAMGALYAKARATNAAVALAYRGFLERMDRRVPVRGAPDADRVASALRSRFPAQNPALRETLKSCEAARWGEAMPASRALALVRALHDYEQSITAHPQARNGDS